MSYQFQPVECALADTDNILQEQIQQDLDVIDNIGSYIVRLAVWVFTTILPFILAFIIVYWIAGKITIGTILTMGLLTVMIYIFLNNMTGSNRGGALPRATYPIPPHLGMDGISGVNRSCVDCL